MPDGYDPALLSASTGRIEIRHLRHFVVVAEELHFGNAAKRLHMAQPPLSQSIRTLEAALGATLFERTSRRVVLTEVGRVFLDQCRPALRQFSSSIESAQRAARGEAGTLSIGYVVSAGFDIVPQVLLAFRSLYPGVHLDLQGMSATEQLEMLRSGGLQVGFVREPGRHHDLNIRVVKKDRLMLAVPAEHPLASAPRVRVRNLEFEPFIMSPRERSPSLHDKIVQICRRAGFSPRVEQHASETQTVLGLVAGGVGVSIVPSAFLALSLPGLVLREFDDMDTSLAMAVVTMKDQPSSVVDAFLEVVQTLFAVPD
ncbi:LysR family transcriptional regulator [Microbacterium sp. CIAB417]|uniref:LysR family transcriptional regulator n=1 Tax=Microbacterium sp. CIAB417 TaxID=2860287 RepID=UPI001FAD3CB2|nr:LysR family transcriptional regulator [Microbacterium sp. CIAB417]